MQVFGEGSLLHLTKARLLEELKQRVEKTQNQAGRCRTMQDDRPG